jgi:hypothetical protein
MIERTPHGVPGVHSSEHAPKAKDYEEEAILY